MKVESFESVTERLGKDIIVLMCFGSSRPEVLENVYKISSLCEFYAPDVPVYGTDIFDTAYYHYGIPTVESNGNTSLSIFPNPVMGDANLTITTNEAGSAMLRIYDINGRCVASRSLGHVSEGEQVYTVSTEGMAKGMYLVNVIIGGHTAATKMMVR